MIRNLPRRLERLETRARAIGATHRDPHILVFLDPVRGETCRFEMETCKWFWRSPDGQLMERKRNEAPKGDARLGVVE